MYRHGRDEDHIFAPAERLFLRFEPTWLDGTGHILPAYIRFPDQSVNREKYSRAYDVLLPGCESKSRDLIYWGVTSITVEDVSEPEERKSADNLKGKSKAALVSFTVEHDPLEDNYGHTELRVYKNGVRTTKSNVSELAKKTYRTRLSQRTKVEIYPAF